MKEDIENLVKERNICKEKCDRVKQNIRLNRQKFSKSVEEFGSDKELDEGSMDAEQLERQSQTASQAFR